MDLVINSKLKEKKVKLIEEKLEKKSEFSMELNKITSPFNQENILKDDKNIILKYRNKDIFIKFFIPVYGIYLILFFNRNLFPSSLIQPLNYWIILFEAIISIILTQILYNFIQFKIVNKSYLPLTFSCILMILIIPIAVLFLLDPIFLSKIIFFDIYSGISLFFSYIIVIWWILYHLDFNN